MQSSRTPLLSIALAAALALPISGCDKSPAELAQEAARAVERGDRPTAVVALKDAIQREPANAEYRFALATIYNSVSDGNSAEKELRKAAELGLIKGGRVAAALGRALLLQGNFPKLLKEVVARDAYEPEPLATVLALRGRAHLALGQRADAASRYDEAAKLAANGLETMVLHALLEVPTDPKSDFARATALLDEALARYPKDLDAAFIKADLLRSQGKIDESLAVVSKIIEQEPGMVRPRMARAQMLVRMRKPDDAQKDVDAVRKVARGNPFLNYTQALIFFTSGKYAQAQGAIQESLKVDPDFPAARLLSATVNYSLGSLSQAERTLATLVREFPNDVYARKLYAATLVAGNDGKRALEVIEPMLGKDLQDGIAMEIAGDAYMKTGAYGKAAEFMERAADAEPKNARLRTGVAMARLGAGEVDKAVAELEAAAKLEGGANRADVLLILTYLRNGRPDQALEAALSLQQKQPNNPLAHNLLGAAYVAKKDDAKARSSFERALALTPDYLPAAENLARMDLADKNIDAAQKRFEGVLAVNRNNVQAMLLLSGLLALKGDLGASIELLERARKADVGAIEPRARLAAHYGYTGERQKALEVAQEAITANPNHPAALQLMGIVQTLAGDANSAVAAYTKVVTVSPLSAQAWTDLAAAQVSAGRLADAEASYRKALNLQPRSPGARVALGALMMMTKRPDEALKIARETQKDNPKLAAAFTLEGDVLAQGKKYAEAMAAYESAMRLGKSGSIAVKIYMVRARAKDGGTALNWLAQWVKDNPKELDARSYLADGLLASQQLKPAVEQYEILTKSAPGNAQALNNMANALHGLKDPRALEVAEKAYKIAPENPLVADTLGWILLESGNTSRALEVLRAAAARAPDIPEIRYHLGSALARSGDKAGARKELEEALRSDRPFPQRKEAKEFLGRL